MKNIDEYDAVDYLKRVSQIDVWNLTCLSENLS